MPQMRSSSVPNIHSASMLKRMCSTPAVQKHVGDELPDGELAQDGLGHADRTLLVMTRQRMLCSEEDSRRSRR